MKPKQKSALAPERLSLFCCQLSLLLEAGVGSEEAVSLLAEDAPDAQGRALLAGLQARLEEGRPLSQALEEAGAFPDYLVRMVEIGQAAGRLDQVFSALAAYYDREAALRDSLRRAVAYPAAMAVLVAVIFLALVSRVLPVFEQAFAQLGVGLSPLAQGLLRFGTAGRYAAGVLVLVLAAAGVTLLLRAQGRGSAFGVLFAKSAPARAVDRSRFASVMALMLSSGIGLDEAMERAGQLLSGSALAPDLARCRQALEEEGSFPRAAERSGIFTGLQAGLLSAGFRSGASERAMEELARRCQEEADGRIAQLLSRFEYALVAALCLVIGLVLLSVMLPLLGVLSAIG